MSCAANQLHRVMNLNNDRGYNRQVLGVRFDINPFSTTTLGFDFPLLQSNDAEVIATIKNTPGAVGYVKTLPAGIKLIKQY